MGAADGHEGPTEAEIAARRRARREAEDRRRMFRRRRLVALAAAVAVAAVPILLIGGGGSEEGSAAAPDAAGTPAAGLDPAPAPELVQGLRGPAPILTYPAIGDAPAEAGSRDLPMTPEEFAKQMEWLARKGFTAVTLTELFDGWDGGEIPKKPVVISFDDGTRDRYEAAAPILAALGWPGVLDLEVANLEQGDLTDEMVSSMLADGWELASQGVGDQDLTLLDEGALEEEVAGSRRELARRFGVPVDFFSYPSGAYDDGVIAAVEEAGYRGATTTDEGLAREDAPFELSRIRVDPGDATVGLEAKMLSAGIRF